jgi:hypothetical protein
MAMIMNILLGEAINYNFLPVNQSSPSFLLSIDVDGMFL